MSSFYGGRPGQSFTIVATFNTLNDMITQFKKGSECTSVHYDEYVLISSGSEKGNIYRRGYNYTNPTGGAELVGNLMGDSTPLELTDIRIGYDGTIYSTAGEAIRTQIENLKSIEETIQAQIENLRSVEETIQNQVENLRSIHSVAEETINTQIENLKDNQGKSIMFTSVEEENNKEEYQIKIQKIDGKPALVYTIKEEE